MSMPRMIACSHCGAPPNAGPDALVPIAQLNEAMTQEGAKDCQIQDLEIALRRYGQHEGGCPAWGRPRPDLCTCGYVAAFRGNYENYQWVRGKEYAVVTPLIQGLDANSGPPTLPELAPHCNLCGPGYYHVPLGDFCSARSGEAEHE